MAHWIADATGADLYRVTTANPYPEDYNQTADIAKRENDNNERPEIRVDITADRLAGYDKVFFGFPVWWYDMPMAMYTFLDSYSLQGKTIIPFFSHEGSSNGASSLQNLERLAGGASVQSSDALSIRGGEVPNSESEVRTWAQKEMQ